MASKPSHDRHLLIHQNEIGVNFKNLGYCLAPIFGVAHLKSHRGQQTRQKNSIRGIVIDHENSDIFLSGRQSLNLVSFTLWNSWLSDNFLKSQIKAERRSFADFT